MPYFGILAPFIFYYFCFMQIIPVTTPILAKQFLQVAININKNDIIDLSKQKHHRNIYSTYLSSFD